MVTPLRVAILNSSRVLGGNEAWVLDTARGLATRNHETLLLLRIGPVAREAARRGLRHHALPFQFEWDPVTLLALASHLRDFHPDTVVITKARDEWAGALAGRGAGTRLLVNRIGLERSYPHDLKRRLLYGKWFERTIVNSKRVGERLVAEGHVPSDRIRVVYDALTPGSFAEARDVSFRDRFGIPREAPLLVSAGRLVAQKGYDRLLEAMARVRQRIPAARLAIAGEGPARADLLARAKGLGVSDGLCLLGQVEEMRGVLGMADLYVQSSRNEGLSGALVEAMASGLPVVATEVGGTREVVTDGVTGLLVPPEDGEALATAILHLLSTPEHAASLGRAARDATRLRFGEEESIARLLEALSP